ncbi:MAG TPA: aquaporin Z [Paraburkholderia sp.]|jgi:aquaporin Z
MVALNRRLWVEGVGTAWLVFVGCGSTVLDTGVNLSGCSGLEMSLAFGLALTTASYAAGGTSGAHFNPAVTVGFTVAQRFPVRDLLPYIAVQLAGAIAAAALLVYVASGRPGFDLRASEFAVNGFDAHSPADYQLHSVLVVEFTLSFAFVLVCLLIVDRKRLAPIAPMIVGASLMLVYLVSIPVTNGAINPARSTAQALFVGNWALDQLWVFWAAPLSGGVAAGVLVSFLNGDSDSSAAVLADGQGDAA